MKHKVFSIMLILALMLPGLAAPASAATQNEINQAIDDGLAWLALQQDPLNGTIWGDYPLADTAMAVLAFENEGNFPGGGNTYSLNVEKGLDYILTNCHPTSIDPQTFGYEGRNDNPDTNGNGKGIYFTIDGYTYIQMYQTGMVMQAIAASNTPDRVVSTGACAGMTYRQVMEDAVDFVALAQIDGSYGRGGWAYYAYYNAAGYADNSNSQWPVLGLIAAEQWGIHAPQWVKDELEYWVTAIQGFDGGSGYNIANDWGPSNVSRTGGLLVEFAYLGDDATTPRVQRALDLINSRWNEGPNAWDGNKGQPYAMFAAFKGLELLKVPTMASAPANDDTPAGDWWGDYSDYLVNTQWSNGSWPGYWAWSPYLATPWYIVILQATVFPVSIDVSVPGAACDQTGYEIDVHFSVERFTASGTLDVYRDGELFDTLELTDFIGTDTLTYNVAPETVGDHTWKAVLDVTGGGITAHAEDTDTGSVFPMPQVSNIPNQVAPFTTFDLDDFQTCDCGNVEWSASNIPAGWTVTIDAEHVVTVTAPEDASDPAEITFTGVFHWGEIDCIGSDTVTFSPNQPPVADPGKSYPNNEYYEVDEGGSVQLDGSNSYDPDGDAIISYDWDLDDDGIFETPGAKPIFSAAALDGPSEVEIHLRVCDEHGACSYGVAEVEVENVAPTIEGISAPADPVNINSQPISVGVTFSDPGILDTHEVTWDWGDGTSTTTQNATSPTSRSHTYAEAGVYEVTLTVTDDDGGTTSQVYQYIVIYDPSAGFVTGGGWIWSQPGAYKQDPALEGKANFGFVAKYLKGATVPTGNTEFQFQVAGLNFHSNTFDWLVITGSNYARFKGIGTVNGEGSYKFQLWAGDGTGLNKADTFRIKIWTEINGVQTIIYDNGMDQAISGGGIVVHGR